MRITLAVAGFSEDELDVSVEENQLVIRGRQIEHGERSTSTVALLHGSSTHVRTGDGMQVAGASLRNGCFPSINSARAGAYGAKN